MSSPLTKEALTRNAWLVELRRQGHRKCNGALFRGHNRVCALGLLAITGGMSRADADDVIGFDHIGALAGLSSDQTTSVWEMNDGFFLHDPHRPDHVPRHTFSEIADVVEGWFPQS